jgi:hypothetical protein
LVSERDFVNSNAWSAGAFWRALVDVACPCDGAAVEILRDCLNRVRMRLEVEERPEHERIERRREYQRQRYWRQKANAEEDAGA